MSIKGTFLSIKRVNSQIHLFLDSYILLQTEIIELAKVEYRRTFALDKLMSVIREIVPMVDIFFCR